ncbi:hypothetical protein OE88DRAFT_487204 [Heliocybe sulcata]|uniref:Uncharacterized protein n=1 Tax=Heliocybe sulcata TaxID=5364 RepID=A0A5C3MT40_9AGAM|nr:hypothetical protein OE88DRAFT_487204 [Heliocybe sulcata]
MTWAFSRLPPKSVKETSPSPMSFARASMEHARARSLRPLPPTWRLPQRGTALANDQTGILIPIIPTARPHPHLIHDYRHQRPQPPEPLLMPLRAFGLLCLFYSSYPPPKDDPCPATERAICRQFSGSSGVMTMNTACCAKTSSSVSQAAPKSPRRRP